jgi:hypothetical protein
MFSFSFYRRREVGFRQGIFLSMAPLATCYAGALAYGITSAHTSIPNWKVCFASLSDLSVFLHLTFTLHSASFHCRGIYLLMLPSSRFYSFIKFPFCKGGPCVLFAIVCWFFIPDSSATARFLTERERQVAQFRSSRSGGEEAHSRKVSWREVLGGLLDSSSAFSLSVVLLDH